MRKLYGIEIINLTKRLMLSSQGIEFHNYFCAINCCSYITIFFAKKFAKWELKFSHFFAKAFIRWRLQLFILILIL